MITTPALYETRVSHVRYRNVRQAYSHRSYLWLIDIDEPPRLRWWLRPFARFDPRDHYLEPRADRRVSGIRADLEQWLHDQGVHLDGGHILLLTAARVFGYVFNPVSVYWCLDRAGDLVCVVVEAHNTYRQRHRYLLDADRTRPTIVPKEFYVSPFLPRHGEYRIHAPLPDQRLSVTAALRHDGVTSLAARLTGHRRAVTTATLLRMFFCYPLAPLRVILAIRRHGIALWLRGLPITPRSAETNIHR
jgi:uncharacterized protein